MIRRYSHASPGGRSHYWGAWLEEMRMQQPFGSDTRKSPLPALVARLTGFHLMLVLLIGCGSIATGPGTGVSEAEGTYLLTIDLGPGASREGIEESHGGKVLIWKPGDFAVVALDSVAACENCSLASLAQRGDIEPNDAGFGSGGKIVGMNGTSTIWSGGTSTIWSGGTSTIWSGGTSTIWSGGTSTIWSGGEYAWMPENTGLWRQIGLERGHEIASNLGFGVKVAVIDTGVDLEHPALKEALAPADEWRDFYGDDALPQEEGELFTDKGYGHGTNVAGIVRQVAPRATILPLRVLGPDGQGDAADLATAIVWAVDRGADVINLSLGAASHVRAVDFALRYAARNGVIVISSTGDTANGEREVTFPASRSDHGQEAPLLLSVTSVDADDAKSSFAPFHHTKVELAAPGESVFGPAPDERKAPWSGTSMSAPMSTGALALALGERLGVPSSHLSELLKTHSTDIYADGLNEDYEGQLGDGRLDVAAFLDQVVRPAGDGVN
jgi:thermitase